MTITAQILISLLRLFLDHVTVSIREGQLKVAESHCRD